MKNNSFFVSRFILLLLIFVFVSFIFVKNVFADADTTPPTGTISINSGALFVNSRNVTLTLSATDDMSGVTEMQFSNGGSYGAFEPYATTKAWTLSASGDGVKTVRVKFKDTAGNITSTGISTTTTLDTVLPTITLVGDSVLNLNVDDIYTEPGADAFDNNKGNFSATVSGIVDTSLAGVYTISYNAVDDAGNLATPVTRTVNVNSVTLPPVILVSVSITNPANKLIYTVDDTLDISGLVLTGTYSDSSTAVLSINDSNISGFDSRFANSSQTLTVTFDGKSTTYNISVIEKPITDVVVEEVPVTKKHTSSGSYIMPFKNQILDISTKTNSIENNTKINTEEVLIKENTDEIKINSQPKKKARNVVAIKKEIQQEINKIEPTQETASAINTNLPNKKWFLGILLVGIIGGIFYKIKKM